MAARARTDDGRGKSPSAAVGAPARRRRRKNSYLRHVDRGANQPLAFLSAVRYVEETGLEPVLEEKLRRRTGRPRKLTVKALLVAMVMHGSRQLHQAHVMGWVRVLNGLTRSQRKRLGLDDDWSIYTTKGRTFGLFDALCEALDKGWEAVWRSTPVTADVQWFMDTMRRPTLELDDVPKSTSIAVDDSAEPTWAATHVTSVVDPVREALDDAAVDPDTVFKATVYGYGPDGRPIYSKDVDARAGHQSGTGTRRPGSYVGYADKCGTQVRDILPDHRGGIRPGPPVPALIVIQSRRPAGSPPAPEAAQRIKETRQAVGREITHVIADRAYSQVPDFHRQLAGEGIKFVYDLKKPQRGLRPAPAGKDGNVHAVMLDGHPFTVHTPEHLHKPKAPLKKGDPKTLEKACAPFEQRSRYAYEFHQFLPDGRIRYLSPFHAGKLRARAFDGKVPRPPDDALLVDVPEDTEPPPATITLRPEDVDLLPQPCLYGTREWVAAYGRRQLVEGTFANLQTSFADFAKSSFVRVNHQHRKDVATAASFAGYNRWILVTFLRLQDEADAWALAEMRRIQAAAKDAADTGDPAAADSLLSLLPEPRSGAPPD